MLTDCVALTKLNRVIKNKLKHCLKVEVTTVLYLLTDLSMKKVSD